MKTLPDSSMLEIASRVVEPERDNFGILRFRTSSSTEAGSVAATMELGGYGVVLMSPSDTWHKQWAVVCWGDYMMTSEGPVPIS